MTNETIKNAIDQSILQNEIVYLDSATQDDMDTLLVECDDSVDNGPVAEFWGEDEDGNTWRVHVTRY